MKIRVRVSAIIFNNENKILLVNHQKEGNNYWVIPGGGVENGETLEKALKRELIEELGIEIENLELAFVGESIQRRHVIDIYFRALSISNTIKFSEEKILKGYGYFGMDEIMNMDFRPGAVGKLIKNILAGKEIQKRYIGNTWK